MDRTAWHVVDINEGVTTVAYKQLRPLANE